MDIDDPKDVNLHVEDLNRDLSTPDGTEQSSDRESMPQSSNSNSKSFYLYVIVKLCFVNLENFSIVWLKARNTREQKEMVDQWTEWKRVSVRFDNNGQVVGPNSIMY